MHGGEDSGMRTVEQTAALTSWKMSESHMASSSWRSILIRAAGDNPLHSVRHGQHRRHGQHAVAGRQRTRGPLSWCWPAHRRWPTATSGSGGGMLSGLTRRSEAQRCADVCWWGKIASAPRMT